MTSTIIITTITTIITSIMARVCNTRARDCVHVRICLYGFCCYVYECAYVFFPKVDGVRLQNRPRVHTVRDWRSMCPGPVSAMKNG